MQEEKTSLTPTEAGADKTPQRLLKDILDKEVAGSAVIHAYGDYAASEDVRAYVEGKKAANNGELVLDADTAESLADQAAIKETMRQRRLGENASVYMKNLGLARVFFETHYLNKQAADKSEDRWRAARRLNSHVEEINISKR